MPVMVSTSDVRTREDPRARLAGAAGFFTQGFVFISLTTRLPAVQDHWGYSDTTLSLLLLMMVLLAGLGTVLAEAACKRVDSAAILRVGLLAIALAVPVLVTAPRQPVLIASMAVYGVALGAVDATTNMQAVALEHLYARPILPSFHGSWTLGGATGAGVALAMGHLPLSATAAVAVVPVVVSLAPFLRRAELSLRESADLAVPWRPIVLVGLAMVLFYMVDTAAFTWGPQYLDKVFPTPSTLVALAVFPYLLASGVCRLAGDTVVARYGAVPVLRVGAVVACGGLAVTVFAPSWPVAVAGFTIMGAGVAVVAPLSFSAAARIAGTGFEGEADSVLRHARVDAVIARFNQFNYAGALLGAVMTGLVGAGNLRIGFAVPMVLVLTLLPLARAFEPVSSR
jgi:Na+/melibiose symporter-like transporter